MEVKQKPRLHSSWIDPRAIEIIKILQNSGFTTYLVGGCIRDLLVGIHPKDFDIATTALPSQVKRRVRNSYIIGRRFRLVLVHRGDVQFQIATFRRGSRPEDFSEGDESPPPGDNFFGTPEEDALRRDFTINGLFYDPIRNELIDYSQGMQDIELRQIKMIGNPAARILEDPIRILRAIRLSHRLNFSLESSLRQEIQVHASSLQTSILPRKREEYIKILKLHDPALALLEMSDLGLLPHIWPTLEELLKDPLSYELFFDYLGKKNDFYPNPDTPTETMAPLLLAFMNASMHREDSEDLMKRFMKVDLGLFKSEQLDFLHGVRLAQKLHMISNYKRRGVRRQKTFLEQPAFHLAFKIATFDHWIDFPARAFWEEQLQLDFKSKNPHN